MTRYGMPEVVQFCKRCTMSNQRPSSVVEWQSDGTRKPHLGFNADGVCAACEYHAMMDGIDWEARERELHELCSQVRSKHGHNDCVVPGSGGKDSAFVAHVLRHRFGMNPLLVTWAPHMYTDVGRRNVERWADSGDHLLFTPRREVHRKLTRLAFLNLCHPFQPFIVGQRNIGPKVAAMYGVPLVFYGEHQAMYAGPVIDNFRPTMERRFFEGSGWRLSGLKERELREQHGLTERDLDCYRPLRGEHDFEVHFMSYYLRWNPQEVFYYAAEHCGFETNDTGRVEGTWQKYSSLDDKIDPLHYYTTLAKFGLGRASYDAAQEIRNRHITRDEGIGLVKQFDAEFPRRYFAECLEYMGIDEATFHATVDAARPEHLWERRDGGWALKSPVWEAI